MGCNTLKVFPLIVNLYLSKCSRDELILLVNRKNFLRAKTYYEDDSREICCIAVYNLSFIGLQDEKYRDILQSCPNDMIVTEIYLGQIWHLLGFNKNMCKLGRIALRYDTIVYPGTSIVPMIETIIGIELYGRDPYPSENTEDIIKRTEKAEGIFIIR
jgi:hypothetical protein